MNLKRIQTGLRATAYFKVDNRQSFETSKKAT